MIEKLKGNSKILKLRITNLYEVDYNLLLNMFWPKKATQWADDLNILKDNQWYTRHKRSSKIVVSMNKLIIENYCRIKQLLYISQNDAVVCYDRIVQNLSLIYNTNFSVPEKLCNLQINTINNTKYHVKKLLLKSNDHYSDTEEYPVYGTGQDSRASGSNWYCTRIYIMKVITKHTIGYTINNSNETKIWLKKIQGTVNNTRQYLNNSHDRDETNVQ